MEICCQSPLAHTFGGMLDAPPPASPNEPASAPYDWSGLRSRRILFAIALLFVFPGSCIALAVADSNVAIALILLALGGSLTLLRGWACPRCGRGFSARGHFPWVAPLGSRCQSCGLPDFTPSAAVAPAIATPDSLAPPTSANPEEVARKRLKRRRMRVGLAFAIPLLYFTMCRLPSGQPAHTDQGHTVRVLRFTRLTQYGFGAGKRTSFVLSCYGPPRDVSVDEVLNLVLPAVRQTGDSIVRLEQVRDDWWLRTLGIRYYYQSSYRLSPDGRWEPQ